MTGDSLGTILIITGSLTALAGLGYFFPRRLLGLALGLKTDDAATILMGRHWCLLVALVGALLIFSAFHSEIRVPAMIVGLVEKFALGILVLAGPLRTRAMTVAIASADATMAVIYLIYLWQARAF